MPIIVENDGVQADISLKNGKFSISFLDPAFVRCDIILVDILRRTIGVVLHEGYHHIGNLPAAIRDTDLKALTAAYLSSTVNGQEFHLKAPVKLS